ncbi:arsenate reductase ArsC [Nocardia abscessus]|uniref:arsenate reductase ArsC n=1 Tax=Nocardia abscessus TaxID=120957 RepID=UPI0024578B35|nr:arsenate reductase ArsC [Nocardia abscessus]
MSHKPSVLFVCVQNAGRSQMAAGFLTALAGDRFDVRSAGSAPAETLNAIVVDAMAEIGIDISGRIPKPLTMDAIGISDVVVTMGAGDACPFFPGISYRDWMLPDPADQTIDVVRTIRDHIRILVENLIAELVPAPAR